MNYLKKFITLNLFAIYGYWALGVFIYYIYINFYDGMTALFSTAYMIGMWCIFFLRFLCAFLIEWIILYILSKILKRKIGLNIQNKTYDFLFRLGIMFSFAPVIMITVYFAQIPISAVIPLPDDTIPYVLLFTLVFYLLIKYVFFRKQK